MDKKRFKIQMISPEQLREILRHRIPCSLFLAKEGRRWVAVDNSDGDAWTEEFSRKHQAIRWLHGKFEVCGKAKLRTRISEANGAAVPISEE